MAKTQDIKRRIRSIQNTRQLTKAMKMVSAAKMRRATEQIVKARPYALTMRAVLGSLAVRANPEAHPLLAVRPERRVEVVVVTADRGLCGSFNSQLIRTAARFLEGHADAELSVQAVGKKGRDFFRRRGVPLRREWIDVFRQVEISTAREIAREVMERYAAESLDAVYVVYNEFKSAIAQKPIAERLLPIDREEIAAGATIEDYIYEPDPEALFEKLLPRHVEIQVYRALLESAAAEHAARMTAMDSATRNAGELIDKLTLHMNRVRQAAITTEIIEVVSGAQALG